MASSRRRHPIDLTFERKRKKEENLEKTMTCFFLLDRRRNFIFKRLTFGFSFFLNFG